MTPLSNPELMATLTEHLTPLTEEKAAMYLAPTPAYVQALAEQISPWPDKSLNQVEASDQTRFQFWFSRGRT